MFMLGYYGVHLTKDRRPRFPARCVVCGTPVSTSKKVFSTPDGHLSLFLWNKLEVPAHKDCARVLVALHYLFFFGVVVPPILLFMPLIFGVGIGKSFAIFILYVSLMGSLYLLVSRRLKRKGPIPFRFVVSDFSDQVSYLFTDKEYAEDFAHLNATVIEQQ